MTARKPKATAPKSGSAHDASDAATAREFDDDPLFVTALARGLDILKSCAQSEVEPSINDVAKRVGLAQATTWRLCHTLIKLGYLERTEHDRLRPGLLALRLGHAALVKSPLSQLARVGMESLAHTYGGAVSIGVPEGNEILYLQRFEGGPVLFRGLRPGSRVSMMVSAMGWGFLAGVPVAERKPLLARIRETMPSDYERLIEQLNEEIAKFPKRRFIVNRGVLHPEVNALAVTVGSPHAAPIACLSFGGPRSTFPSRLLEETIGPALLELADSLTLAVDAGVQISRSG